jgi:hypothetical protein
MATSLTLQNDASLAQGYVKVNGTTSATFTTSGITGNLTGNVTGSLTAGGSLTLATAQTATGTSVDFTGIPSWAKRITVMFGNVSLSGTSNLLVQIGNTTPTTSGYTSNTSYNTGAGVGLNSSTAGMLIQVGVAAYLTYGTLVFTNISGNIWVANGVLGNSITTPFTINSLGIVTLASALNILRITTVNGTDTFDAGTINISFEG